MAGVKVKELGVTTPVDGCFDLPLALLFAELLVEHVEEKVLRHGVVAFGYKSAVNLAEEQDVGHGCVAEELLLSENLGVGELSAAGCDDGVTFFDLKEAEQLSGVDDGEQIVDFEGKVVGQTIDVVAAALVEQ